MEFVQHNDGSHKVIVLLEMHNSICDAHKTYKTRKIDKELPAAQFTGNKKEEEVASKRRAELIEKAEKEKGNLKKGRIPSYLWSQSW